MGGIRLRPHHLLCIQGFRGQGYSPTFVANMARLKEMLDELPETAVEIAGGVDDICGFCPHLDDGACVRQGQRVDELDRRILARLGLAAGDTSTWSQLVDGIREKVEPTALAELCGGCNWLDLGFCAKGVADLQ